MNSESEQIWRWYFHLTDHFLIFIFAPQLCKRTFLTLENESTSCNPCLDMRPLQQIQCQDNLGITWTLFNLVYRDFIHENTCTIMECLSVSSILCAWGGKLILSTTCASGLFVYICLFERCVPACMQSTEHNLSFYHVGGPWNWTLVARLDGKHLYSMEPSHWPSVTVLLPLSSLHDKFRSDTAFSPSSMGKPEFQSEVVYSCSAYISYPLTWQTCCCFYSVLSYLCQGSDEVLHCVRAWQSG